MTNGVDTFEYDLANPSQPMNVRMEQFSHLQTYKESADDFVTTLSYSPTKFIIQGMISGLVQVKYLESILSSRSNLVQMTIFVTIKRICASGLEDVSAFNTHVRGFAWFCV